MLIIKAKDKKAIGTAAKALKQGKTIVAPTDTVYGLICDAKNKKAVKRIFEIKKRPKSKSFPIFIKDIKTAKKLAFIGKEQEKFLKKFWPGKATFILKSRSKNYPLGVLSENGKIGLRMPKYDLINILLKKTNMLLVGTSANISGKPASGNIKEVLRQFTLSRGEGPDLIIAAGNLKKSKPSTIINLTSRKPEIIREGAIKWK